MITLADVDEIAVERASRGDRAVDLTRAEMAEAFRYLDEHGYSASQIADRLGVTQRTVERWRGNRHLPIARMPAERRAAIRDTPVPCPECDREVLPRHLPRHLRNVHAAARDAALAERYGDDGRQIGAA